jgi:hypothetical protein
MKMIEELLEGVEKKVHAGEWIRINDVRMLLNKAINMTIEEFEKKYIIGKESLDSVKFELGEEE